ncbi:DUF2510 domain-containing protein [Streptomyces sp. NPDC048514]|uniref:DUF2510 domain-containing protein n=1 Tax=Streptomyces sp. NPDC048514 TaxID=3365564 RepID=UPI00371F9B86
MTQVTPPGWYPDPGQTNDGPPTERWWDGEAWTDRTRPAGTAAAWGPPTHPGPGTPQPGQPAPPAHPAPPAGAAPSAPGGYGVPPGAAPMAPGGYGMPAGAAPTVPGGYGPHPGYGGFPQPPAAGSRRGLRTGIAVAVAAAVLVSIGVGVYALAKDDGGGGNRAGSQGQGQDGGRGGPFGGPGGTGGSGGPGDSGGTGGSGGPGDSGGTGGGSASPGPSQAPKVQGGGTVQDPADGISLHVPEGWTGQTFRAGAQITSGGAYKCPGDSDKTCTPGGAYTAPAALLKDKGETAEEVAKADIAANAEQSYGGATYGAVTSHKVLASRAVTVAGQKGYRVRWKAVTSKGADGYVESVAFPSPGNAQQIVVVRFGVDVGQKVSVIDEILKGIKASSADGAGQDV